ncbi:hypothetical protein CB1_000667015 [Camelus ferus]|nr:hypothetical protein CB1_000667015 [Camelus ferus]
MTSTTVLALRPCCFLVELRAGCWCLLCPLHTNAVPSAWQVCPTREDEGPSVAHQDARQVMGLSAASPPRHRQQQEALPPHRICTAITEPRSLE